MFINKILRTRAAIKNFIYYELNIFKLTKSLIFIFKNVRFLVIECFQQGLEI